MIRRFYYILFFPAVLAMSCRTSEAEERKAALKEGASAETPAGEKGFIDVVKVEKGNVSGSLKIPGELIAHQQVDLYAKVNSFVKKLYADVGTEVKEGQLLATMEAPEISSQLAGAESRLRSQEAVYLSSKATYDRIFETSKTPGTISPNDLDIAQAKQKSDYAQFEAAKAAYREITDARNYLEIRAPFKGVITARNVSAGAYVGPSGKGSDLPLFTLQEQEKLRLVVSVPEAYTGSLHNHDEVEFTVRSQPQPFKAKLTRMAGAMDTRLRAQRIEMDVWNKDKTILPGMVCEVSIPLNGKDSAYLVPSSAVLNSTLGVFVIKLEEGKTIWVPVKTGNTANKKTEIFGALNVQDTIVQFAVEEIRNGAFAGKVRVKK